MKDFIKKEGHYAQNGEDEVIANILKKIEKNDNRWCVEFGAWDGITGSNTYRFITKENYSSVLIEANQSKYNDLVENMKGYNAKCFCKFVSFMLNSRVET